MQITCPRLLPESRTAGNRSAGSVYAPEFGRHAFHCLCPEFQNSGVMRCHKLTMPPEFRGIVTDLLSPRIHGLRITSWLDTVRYVTVSVVSLGFRVLSRLGFLPRELCSRGISHGRLSVRPSVTSRCSTKMAKHRKT